MSKGWKDFERDVADAVGGRRRPVTGIDRADGDVFTSRMELQVKRRFNQAPARYLLEWLDGIRVTAASRAKVGAVVWKRPGVGAVGESLVVLTLEDFLRLVGRGGETDGEN